MFVARGIPILMEENRMPYGKLRLLRLITSAVLHPKMLVRFPPPGNRGTFVTVANQIQVGGFTTGGG